MNDGIRTHDNRDHNPGLYQLSYAHHSIFFLRSDFRPRLARPAGFEPATLGLEGRCSIQMSYGRIRNWSGWRDSNSRHPAPKAGALPGCATPRFLSRPKDRAQMILGAVVEVNNSIQNSFQLVNPTPDRSNNFLNISQGMLRFI